MKKWPINTLRGIVTAATQLFTRSKLYSIVSGLISRRPKEYKFLRILVLEFISTLLIVGCTREYVGSRYLPTAAFELAWITQWFYASKLFNEQEETRSWTLGFPA